jgi:hypothetical protein
MEALCMAQRKLSPLAQVSQEFLQNHPHPYLREFQRLAQSPRAQPTLCLPTIKEYGNDMMIYANLVLFGRRSGESAREEMLARQQKALNAKTDRWARIAEVRQAGWKKQVDP